jgi:FtsP/CotA-like multicopper oxidase with cupredoxin domain
VDLVVDAKLKPGSKSPIQFVSDRQKIDIATLEYKTGELATPAILTPPSSLQVTMPHADFNLAAAKTVDLNMTGGAMGSMDRAMLGGKMLDWRQLVKKKRVWAFNGIAGDLDKPLAQVKQGETVRIDIVNDTAFPHAMHLHGHHFTVVAKNNMSVAERVWRDTELVYPDEKISFAFLADNPGKWLFHCHMIEHQAGGMMTWIDVV